MELYTGNQYIFLFFIYGLAFFCMGILALHQNVPKGTNLLLLKSIKCLGYFGIIHGITEWVIMLRITRVYAEQDIYLLMLATFLNALSFVCLWTFGIKVFGYKGNYKKIIKFLPWIIFSIWAGGFIISHVFYDINSLNWLFVEDILSRYLIGFPGAITTAVALVRNAKMMEKIRLKRIGTKLRGLAFLFTTYGVLAGMIVDERGFFPASILHKDLFRRLFGFPVELGRALTAIGIILLFTKIIDVFLWETSQKITQLSKRQAVSRERRRLALELHDVIIQNLFAAGIQIENLIEKEEQVEEREILLSIKENLNSTIDQARAFIGKISISNNKVEIEEIKGRIAEVIGRFEKQGNIPIRFQYNETNITLGYLSEKQLVQIGYIVQEAVSNAMRHAEALEIKITIDSTWSEVTVTVEDDGVGFDLNSPRPESHYGLISMEERTREAKGMLSIASSSKGTKIVVTIPWEEYEDGRE